MAKKSEKPASENIEKEEKQEPQKPKKEGGINIPLIGGIIGGVIIIQAILIIVIFQLFVSPIYQHLPTNNKKAEVSTEQSDEEASKSEESSITPEEEKNIVFIETGRITTNPLASSKFVVINLGLMLIATEEEQKKELSHEIDKSLLGKKLMAGTKENINNLIGSLTADELSQIKRDSLKNMIVESLKPIFKKNKIKLYDVKLQEFIIQ